MTRKIFVLFFALTAILSSCNKSVKPTNLNTPVLTILEQTATSFTVNWEAVAGAESYVYTLNDSEETTTTQNIVTFNEMETSIYLLKVKAVNSETESEWAELTITLVPDSSEGFAVEINVKDVEATTATVEFIPSDNETQFFARVITVAELENLNITEDSDLIIYLYENPNQADYVYSGAQILSLERLSPNYEYIAIAFEYVEPELIEVVYKETFTTADANLDHSMVIENITPDYTGVTFTVTPGNDQEYWYFYCMEKSLYEEFGDDVMIYTYYGMQNLAFELGYGGGMAEMLQDRAKQGAAEVVETGLKHSTEYVAMAFYVDPTSTDPTNIYDWSYVAEEFSTLVPTSDAPIVTISEPVVTSAGGAYNMTINVKLDPTTTIASYGTSFYSSCEAYFDQGWEAIKAFFFLKELNAEQLSQAQSAGGLDFQFEGVEADDYLFMIEAKNAQGVTVYEGVRIDISYFN